jgi:hypothetical protein
MEEDFGIILEVGRENPVFVLLGLPERVLPDGGGGLWFR